MNIRLSLVLLTALALVAGWVFFYELRIRPEPAVKAPWFYLTDTEAIVRVSVTTGGQTSAYHYDQEAKVWRFDDAESTPVDQAKWSGKVLLLSGPVSRSLLKREAAQEELTEFGLQSPATTATIFLKGERQITVLLGDATVDGMGTYSMLQGFPEVYLIEPSWAREIARLVVDPPFPNWYLRISPQDAVALKLSHGGAAIAFLKDGAGWRFDEEAQRPVDPSRWQSLLPLLGGPARVSLLQEGVQDFAPYGITEEGTRISISYIDINLEGNPETDAITYAVGNRDPGSGGYYAQATFLAPGNPAEKFDLLLLLDAVWVEGLIAVAEAPPYPAP